MALKKDEAQAGPSAPVMGWGSDVVAEMLRRLDIDFICVNPGSSFRGLHDSLINYLGNDGPQMLLSLHEQSVVAIAHGYAKAAGKPMAVVLHSNVGLLAGMMSIFNAWCDRAPILMLGATGAVDTNVRRSWIDWSHTFRDQGALIRNFVKWDEQPVSPQASVDSMLRAYQAATTAPQGPAYVSLDRRLQEDALKGEIVLPDVALYAPPAAGVPSDAVIERAAAWLAGAERPVILVGRVSSQQADWDARIRLAEVLNARVITDLKFGASFPTRHPLYGGPADLFLLPEDRKLLAEADVVLSLDWYDLADCLNQVQGDAKARAKVIQVSIDAQVHNGYSGDHQRLVAADLNVGVAPDAMVGPLLANLERRLGRTVAPWVPPATVATPMPKLDHRVSTLSDIGAVFSHLRQGRKICLARVPLNWPGASYAFEHPLDYLGYDVGGGVGSGPGMSIGTAIALEGTDRTVVGIMGDGEFLGATTALWTAAHYKIPVLIVVANNRSYFTDEVQQEIVARERDRAVENRWIGQRIDDPPADLAGIARDFGVEAEGPVMTAAGLLDAVRRGLEAVEAGKPYLIDVLIDSSRGASMDWLDDA